MCPDLDRYQTTSLCEIEAEWMSFFFQHQECNLTCWSLLVIVNSYVLKPQMNQTLGIKNFTCHDFNQVEYQVNKMAIWAYCFNT